MSVVSFVLAEALDSASIGKAIETSLSLIGFDFEKAPQKIVIKPNLCYYYDYSTGETTDPRFVSILIDVLRKLLSSDPDIFVVESDASAMKCKYSLRMLGYEKMAKEKNVSLLNLTEEENHSTELKINNFNFEFHIPHIFREADLLVNVPKIKYQSGVQMTCALKNIFGCNAYPKKYVYHRALSEAIVGINELIKSNLVVADGIVVNGVKTKRLGLVMASIDPVALDAAAARILGLNPKSVKHIMLAYKEGLGNVHFIPRGESFEFVKRLFPKRKLRDKIRERLARAYIKYFR